MSRHLPALLASILAVSALPTAPVSAAPLTTPASSGLSQDKVQETAQKIEEDLGEINAKHQALFDHPWFGHGIRWFGDAQNAILAIRSEGTPDLKSVTLLNDGLEEFLRAIEDVQTGNLHSSRKQGPAPSTKSVRALKKDIERVQKLANSVPELRAIRSMQLTKTTSVREVVEYVDCMVESMTRLAFSRGGRQITGDGGKRTREELAVYLNDVREAANALTEGLDTQLAHGADVPKPTKEQVENLYAALKTAGTRARIFSNAFPFSRERVKQVVVDLRTIEKNLGVPACLK